MNLIIRKALPIAFACALFLPACGGELPSPEAISRTEQNFDKINVGMTKDEIGVLIGEPYIDMTYTLNINTLNIEAFESSRLLLWDSRRVLQEKSFPVDTSAHQNQNNSILPDRLHCEEPPCSWDLWALSARIGEDDNNWPIVVYDRHTHRATDVFKGSLADYFPID